MIGYIDVTLLTTQETLLALVIVAFLGLGSGVGVGLSLGVLIGRGLRIAKPSKKISTPDPLNR